MPQKAKPFPYETFDALLADDTDIVVEIAGVGAVKEYVVPLLEAGKDVVITSVGALADTALYDAIESAAKKRIEKCTSPPEPSAASI